MSINKIKTGVANYYGEILFIKDGDRYFIELENWNQYNRKEITKKLYDAAKEINWGEAK